MSRHIPSRNPAWNGLTPKQPDFAFRPVNAQAAERLLSRYFDAAQITGRINKAEGPIGHFLVAHASGAYVLHVKTVSAPQDLEVTAAISEFIAERGLPVASYVRSQDGAIEESDGDLVATVTTYVSARHAKATCADAAAVATLVSKIHRVLADFPGARAVRERGEAVVETLSNVRRLVNERGVPDEVPVRYRRLVEVAARTGDPTFMTFGEPQCLHGDLSPGNILFDEHDEARLIDFEDAAFAWRPVAFDLGMAVLRFALCGGEGDDNSTPNDRLAAFLRAYNAGGTVKWEPRAALEAVRAVCANAALVMTYLAQASNGPDEGEWEKLMAWSDMVDGMALK